MCCVSGLFVPRSLGCDHKFRSQESWQVFESFLKHAILCLGQRILHHSVTFTVIFFLMSSLFQMLSGVQFCVSKEDQRGCWCNQSYRCWCSWQSLAKFALQIGVSGKALETAPDADMRNRGAFQGEKQRWRCCIHGSKPQQERQIMFPQGLSVETFRKVQKD